MGKGGDGGAPLEIEQVARADGDVAAAARRRRGRDARPIAQADEPRRRDGDVAAAVEMLAPSRRLMSRGAEMVIEPASPVPVEAAVICGGPEPMSRMSEPAVTVIVPPLPVPEVLVEMPLKLPPMARLPALTWIVPALPGPPGRRARLPMPVSVPAPSMVSAPPMTVTS
ncbi:MAG: hypothetical protein ACJ8AW_48555, partial [Rhodopila sp.]